MAVAVALRDPSIEIVDPEFGALVAADRATAVDGFTLGVVMAAGAL